MRFNSLTEMSATFPESGMGVMRYETLECSQDEYNWYVDLLEKTTGQKLTHPPVYKGVPLNVKE